MIKYHYSARDRWLMARVGAENHCAQSKAHARPDYANHMKLPLNDDEAGANI